LQRRHIHRYVEEKNRETSVAARIFKPQQIATAKSGLKQKRYVLVTVYLVINNTFYRQVPRKPRLAFPVKCEAYVIRVRGEHHFPELFKEISDRTSYALN